MIHKSAAKEKTCLLSKTIVALTCLTKLRRACTPKRMSLVCDQAHESETPSVLKKKRVQPKDILDGKVVIYNIGMKEAHISLG